MVLIVIVTTNLHFLGFQIFPILTVKIGYGFMNLMRLNYFGLLLFFILNLSLGVASACDCFELSSCVETCADDSQADEKSDHNQEHSDCSSLTCFSQVPYFVPSFLNFQSRILYSSELSFIQPVLNVSPHYFDIIKPPVV